MIINIIDGDYFKLWATTAVSERKKLYKERELPQILEKVPNLQHPNAFELVGLSFL